VATTVPPDGSLRPRVHASKIYGKDRTKYARDAVDVAFERGAYPAILGPFGFG